MKDLTVVEETFHSSQGTLIYIDPGFMETGHYVNLAAIISSECHRRGVTFGHYAGNNASRDVVKKYGIIPTFSHRAWEALKYRETISPTDDRYDNIATGVLGKVLTYIPRDKRRSLAFPNSHWFSFNRLTNLLVKISRYLDFRLARYTPMRYAACGLEAILLPTNATLLISFKEEMRQIFEHERPQVVNHLAAQVDVRSSVIDPVFDADINILAGIKLIQLCVEFGAPKFIYISSGGAVYGEPEYLPCDENHPVHPLAPYGASKYSLELYLYLYKQNFDMDYTVLRYGNVYGPRQDPNGEAGVVAIFTGQMLQDRQVTINGCGEQERDFIYVSDCARANLLVLEQGSGRTYNFASGMGVSINQIFASLQEITACQGDPRHGPAKPGETFRIYLDTNRARQELGWEPTVGLEQGLRQTVEYFRQAEID